MTAPLVLTGRVVSFDPALPVIERGAVYIGEDEKIAAVQGAQERAPSGFDGAPRLRTGGTIYPGSSLIGPPVCDT